MEHRVTNSIRLLLQTGIRTREVVKPFSFLEQQNKIYLLLSDPGRIPLRVHGQVPAFGMIDLELKKLIR